MTTLCWPQPVVDKREQSTIDSIAAFQSTVVRCAYNACVKHGTDDLVTVLNIVKSNYDFSVYGITDTRYRHYAVREGIGCYKVDVAKSRGVDFKPRVFGGHHNFIRYMKGLIGKDEWHAKRMRGLIAEGESDPVRRGNRKFDFLSDRIVFKPWRGVKIEFPLPRLRTGYRRVYDAILAAIEDGKCPPVTVKLVNGQVQLTVDRNKLKPWMNASERNVIKGRYLGVDMNPNHIGVSFFDERNELLDTRLYSLSQLTGRTASHDKLVNEVSEIAHEIGRIARGYRIQYMFVEDLSGLPTADSGRGCNYNRLCRNQFIRRRFIDSLRKHGVVVEVNAAYSSTIGNVLHGHRFPDPVAASMEIARRGIENRIVRGGGRFMPPLPSLTHLQNLGRGWQDVPADVVAKGWAAIHDWTKRAAVRVRSPVPTHGYRCFRRTARSKVNTLDQALMNQQTC